MVGDRVRRVCISHAKTTGRFTLPSPSHNPENLDRPPASARHLLGRLWREHVARYGPWLIVAALFMTIEGAALGGFAYMIRPLFDDLFEAGSLDGVGWIAFAIAGLFVMRAVAGFFQRLIVVSVGLRVTTSLQTRLVKHLLGLDLSFYQRNSPGALIERVRGDTQSLQGVASTAVMSLGRDTITLVALLAVMFVNDWRWTLLALIGVPLLVLPLLLVQRFIRRTALASREVASRLSTRLDEAFHGIQSIKLNRLEAHEEKRFRTEVRGFLRQAMRAQIGLATNPAMIDFIAAAGFVAVLYYGGGEIIAGEKSVGEFMSFFTALGLIFDPLRRLSNLAGHVQAALASLDRLYSVLEVEPTIRTPATPKAVPMGDIAFDDVRFDYGDGPVLRGLSFTAEAGKTTALVGPSGAGKTTVFGLLTRLVDPVSGRITIGGETVNTLDLDGLRDGIAVVGQETALFDESIAQNIRLGRLDATQPEIETAALEASVLDFTKELSEGLETKVGPRGASLSGGQRQRVAIARAILKSAPVLLLDEPTSALDARSEKLVQEALSRLSKDRTTIVIAHRLSTIRSADKIVVLDQGRVIEEGNHDVLMAKDGAYAKLNALQSAGMSPAL